VLTDTKQDSISLTWIIGERKDNGTKCYCEKEKPNFQKWKKKIGNSFPLILKRIAGAFTFDKLVKGAFINETDPKEKRNGLQTRYWFREIRQCI